MVSSLLARWLSKAKDDLKWAQANIKSGIYYGACFAAQQAVEKALKAYLLFQGERLRKVHDLVMLVDEAKRFDANFDQFRDAAARISQYYVETRYPDINPEKYTRDEAEKALSLAKEIVELVKKRLPNT